MKGETRERWQTLCARAADEQDPGKLMKLIEEINQLLETKEERLLRERRELEAKKESAA
jgi:hypothetical protein